MEKDSSERKLKHKISPFESHWFIGCIILATTLNSIVSLFSFLSYLKDPSLISLTRLQQDSNLSLKLGLVSPSHLIRLVRPCLAFHHDFLGREVYCNQGYRLDLWSGKWCVLLKHCQEFYKYIPKSCNLVYILLVYITD